MAAWAPLALLGASLARPADAQQGALDPFAARPAPGEHAASRGNAIGSSEFVKADITILFKAISDLTGWSVVMSPEVAKTPPQVNLWVKDLSAEQVLEEVARAAGLVVQREGNVVRVMTFEEHGRRYGLDQRVIALKHSAARELAALLLPLIESDPAATASAKVAADESGNKIVLLLPAPLADSVASLVEQLDTPRERDVVRLVPVKNLDVTALVPDLERFLTESASGGERRSAPAAAGAEHEADTRRAGEGWLVQFMVEPKLNVLVLRGQAADVEKTAALVAQLDVDAGVHVATYPLRFTNAAEIHETLRALVEQETRTRAGGVAAAPRLRVAASEQNNMLVVEGSAEDQRRIAQIIESIDRPLPAGSGGIRVYRLENAASGEVAAVLRALVEARAGRGAMALQQRPMAAGGLEPAVPATDLTQAPIEPQATPVPDGATLGRGQLGPGDILAPQITEAPQINAVIVKAAAVEQDELKQVIDELDKPRDQVMLEVTLVALRSTDDFSLGVELSSAYLNSDGVSSIGFTKYGIGDVDSSTGAIRIDPQAPFGLNYAIFDSDDFSLVLNALQTIGHTRVSSAPKILIEDNAQGEIRQVNEEPYEKVNQGDTTTTTSFGGFVEAGTTLTVTPHVAEGEDWLRLEYTINLSRFGNRVSPRLPPPRLQNQIQGTVRVPGGHTVALGGLVASRDDEVEESVPLLGDLPLVGELFKNRTRNAVQETLFVFIRPLVLRQRGFADLRFLSEQDLRAADLAREHEPQNPLKLLDAGAAVDVERQP